MTCTVTDKRRPSDINGKGLDRSAVYLHFQRQRKARPETDRYLVSLSYLSTNPISISHDVFHTSFSKTILHTLVYARHVHELQTAKPWAGQGGGGGGRIREQKLILSSNFELKRGGGVTTKGA